MALAYASLPNTLSQDRRVKPRLNIGIRPLIFFPHSALQSFPGRFAQVNHLLALDAHQRCNRIVVQRELVPKGCQCIRLKIKDFCDLPNAGYASFDEQVECTAAVDAEVQKKSEPLIYGQSTDFIPKARKILCLF